MADNAGRVHLERCELVRELPGYARGQECALLRESAAAGEGTKEGGDRLLVRRRSPQGDLQTLESLAGKAHMNVATVYDAQKADGGGVVVWEEWVEGAITLREKLNGEGLDAGGYEDCLYQLCDALAFLSALKPPVSHNAITPENVLVGEENLVKLANFTQASQANYDVADDIHMLGVLAGSVNAKYVKRYQRVIRRCLTRAYGSVEELRKDISKQTRLFMGMSIGVFLGLAGLFAALLGISRIWGQMSRLLKQWIK